LGVEEEGGVGKGRDGGRGVMKKVMYGGGKKKILKLFFKKRNF
jgi:hypothetical protein